MVFELKLKQGSRTYYMWCERIEKGHSFEKFMIWPRDNPHKWMVLQTNRPLIRNKLNLKTKRYSWKVIEGDIKNQRAFEETIELIEKYLEDHPDTPTIIR
jgi:hypothetical protein